MIEKKELRKLFEATRKTLTVNEKSYFDSKIFTFLVNSELYRNAELLLVYVSYNGEVDTLRIIKRAFLDGKKVAVPYCHGNEMEFLIINSFDYLSKGKFGILSADPNKCETVVDFQNTLCIVPALSFDVYGNRLGYGGGYYDRFLSKNSIETVGLCYERCISHSIPNEKFDIVINFILTENGLKKSEKEVSA